MELQEIKVNQKLEREVQLSIFLGAGRDQNVATRPVNKHQKHNSTVMLKHAVSAGCVSRQMFANSWVITT